MGSLLTSSASAWIAAETAATCSAVSLSLWTFRIKALRVVEDEGEEVLGGDDNVDYPQHDNVDHENDLPLGGEDWEYPEFYRGEDSHENEEADLEEETPSVPTDEHTIRKKVLPAEQARLGLVNRAMNKLLSDESMPSIL